MQNSNYTKNMQGSAGNNNKRQAGGARPPIAMENISDADGEEYIISPFVRDPIRPDFPDEHHKLVNDKSHIAATKGLRDQVEGEAKESNYAAARSMLRNLNSERCDDLYYDIAIDNSKGAPKRVGILYTDRPRDGNVRGNRNVLPEVLAYRVAEEMRKRNPDISWVLIPAYQLQKKSRTVKDENPHFENRSRFILKKPRHPEDLPTDYIIVDDVCAKGDTMAEMYSLATKGIGDYLGKPTRVLATAVLESDYRALAADEQDRRNFNECFTQEQQTELSGLLSKIGLSCEALTHGQMEYLKKDSDRIGAQGVINKIRESIDHTEVPEPEILEKTWLLEKGVELLPPRNASR